LNFLHISNINFILPWFMLIMIPPSSLHLNWQITVAYHQSLTCQCQDIQVSQLKFNSYWVKIFIIVSKWLSLTCVVNQPTTIPIVTVSTCVVATETDHRSKNWEINYQDSEMSKKLKRHSNDCILNLTLMSIIMFYVKYL
jgi:hypothetical protein